MPVLRFLRFSALVRGNYFAIHSDVLFELTSIEDISFITVPALGLGLFRMDALSHAHAHNVCHSIEKGHVNVYGHISP